MNLQQAVYKFGLHEFNPAQYELRTGALRIVLPVSLNRLLLLFVTHPGEVVTRQQIADELWEDHTTIDVGGGINTAVKRLRIHLDDGSGEGSAIETLVGVGYRFAGPVTLVPTGSSTNGSETKHSSATEVIESPEPGPASPSPIPLAATVPGLPAKPTEDAVPRKSSRIWIGVAAAAVLLLTTATAIWSYFSSKRPAHQVELTIDAPFLPHSHPFTSEELDDQLTAQAISPSGTYLLYADRSGLTLRNLKSGQEKRLDLPKAFRVEALAWFPDESSLLASGAFQPNGEAGDTTPKNQTWAVALSGTLSHLLLEDAAMACVSPDGRSLAYLRAGKTEVWIANTDGTGARKLVAATSGDSFSALLWSPRSDRIVVDRSRSGIEMFPSSDPESGGLYTDHQKSLDSDYESYDTKTGALRSSYPVPRFDSAILLPDGSLLYLSNKAGKSGLAIVQTDRATGAVLDQKWVPGQQLWAPWETGATQLSSTRNGETLSAIVDRPAIDVFTADLTVPRNGDPPRLDGVRRLSFHAAGSSFPSGWTPDGKGVVFDDGMVGPVSVAVQGLDGAPLQHLVNSTQDTLSYCRGQFSPGGNWLLFEEFDHGRAVSINRVAIHGGTPEALHTTGNLGEFHCSGSPNGRCVLREAEGKNALVYYALDPVSGIGAELARVPWQANVLGDWNISPDGRTVAMANHDPQNPSIQLVPLAPAVPGKSAGPEMKEMKDIPLRGFGTAFSAHWSQDGKALFVETFKAPKYQLVWLPLNGDASVLRQSDDLIWGVPSPDGKKVAFPDRIPLNRNIWVGATNWESIRTK